MELDKLDQKLKVLKRKGVNVSIKNRKLADREIQEAGLNRKPKVYSMEDVNDGAEPVEDAETSDKDKAFHYTVQEYNAWKQKQNQRKNGQGQRSGNSYDQVAKLSYEKTLRNLVTQNSNKNENSVNKNDSNSSPKNGAIHKIQRNIKTGKIEIVDDDKLVNKLAFTLESESKKRYEARRKQMENAKTPSSVESFINDKNKQFNEKLSREPKDSN
ncbi:Syf2p SKDI_07G3760 [Saccharomyces kudriavzevii IFO 1802]|uniref:Pre-mRNA-splicing factor SYF2 n=1 Tax=Saccharomyces kudriavzevii (strain ATCC MYA-4449 / AS 2.2408 / CBS 8840 / NBRC 1802 / NCYC 2889) TaxID=226230 RepID=A0AA35NTN5_SACK1|nr:uncharacterized protein SKDI_07G3760 [Saccharomyces kudriavzevii IFO 1802]CAI4062504.1 hypothetical protein SKDI_07G3760 [Saccharomyces kudriavzevii IFO 1802]